MSGTSLDGIDAVLADFSSSSPSLLHAYYQAYDPGLRNRLLELHLPGHDELHRAAMVSNELAHHYAQAVAELLRECNVKTAEVAAIGCHGQTVRHCPEIGRDYTIQLYNPALLVELSGIPWWRTSGVAISLRAGRERPWSRHFIKCCSVTPTFIAP